MNDPHADQPIRHAGAPLAEASAAMILLHGRGASADAILSLTRVLDVRGIACLAPQAAGNTWYPHSFLAPRQQNEPYLSSALRAVETVITQVEHAGFARDRIILLGFSQGACLAAEFAAAHPARYGGIALLTGGLIGQEVDRAAYSGSFAGTPVLLASGDPDAHVPWSRVEQTAEVYRAMGADVTVRRYPGRPHTVSQEEVELVQAMLNTVTALGGRT